MLAALYIFARLVGILAIAMAPSAFVASLDGDAALVGTFVITGLLLGFGSGLLVYALRGQERRMRRTEALTVAALVWLGFPALATPPFLIHGLSPLDAYFHAVSAFTTTGASLIAPGNAARAVLFWQASLQWLGGLSTLLTIILLVVPTGAGGLPVTLMRLVDHIAPSASVRLSKVIRAVLPLYAGMTLACVLLLVASGVSTFNAFCVAFSTVSTGGMMPVEGGLSGLGSIWVLPVVTLFMIYGATSVLWHRMAVTGDAYLLSRHRESYILIGLCALLGLAYASATLNTGQGAARTLWEALAMATSVITTSGFEPRVGLISTLPIALIGTLAVVGGGTFSTAGGIKLHRISELTAQSFRELRQLVYPNGVLARRVSTYRHEPDRMSAIWSLFAAFFFALAICAAIVSWTHASPMGALLLALSAIVNNGPLYSLAWPDASGWPTYAGLAASAKLTLAVTMVLGRVELIAVLSLVLSAWRRR